MGSEDIWTRARARGRKMKERERWNSILQFHLHCNRTRPIVLKGLKGTIRPGRVRSGPAQVGLNRTEQDLLIGRLSDRPTDRPPARLYCLNEYGYSNYKYRGENDVLSARARKQIKSIHISEPSWVERNEKKELTTIIWAYNNRQTVLKLGEWTFHLAGVFQKERKNSDIPNLVWFEELYSVSQSSTGMTGVDLSLRLIKPGIGFRLWVFSFKNYWGLPSKYQHLSGPILFTETTLAFRTVQDEFLLLHHVPIWTFHQVQVRLCDGSSFPRNA